MRSPDWQKTRIKTELDFVSAGKRFGELRLKPSNNRVPLGYIPIPAAVVVGEPGPTILLTAGVHGDEYEGQVALRKLISRLAPDSIHGRLIILPSLNIPAVNAASRISVLDQGNLNRAFPGNVDGAPTAEIANLVEAVILPVCDYAIDLHSGGKAAWFLPCAMAGRNLDGSLCSANIDLARAFKLAHILLMNAYNDDRTLNAAAARQNVTMIALELGGGGHITPEVLALAEQGLDNCLRYIGIIGKSAVLSDEPTFLQVTTPAQSVHARQRGLFEPTFAPGDLVKPGNIAGYIYSIDELEQPACAVNFATAGVVTMRCHRGLVEKGELLAIVGAIVPNKDLYNTKNARPGKF